MYSLSFEGKATGCGGGKKYCKQVELIFISQLKIEKMKTMNL